MENEGRIDDVPLVTVIVPVWNDIAGIERCLTSLQRQSYPASRLQLIVVDNGSTDGSYEHAQSFAGVTVLREPTPGRTPPGTPGWRAPKGAMSLCSTLDCVADRLWIEQAVATAMRHPNLGVLAGRVRWPATTPLPIQRRRFTSACFPSIKKQMLKGEHALPPNWMSPKTILDAFGGFDARLKSGGDSKLSHEIGQRGHPILYCDTMVVHHPARSTVRELISKRRRVVGENGQLPHDRYFDRCGWRRYSLGTPVYVLFRRCARGISAFSNAANGWESLLWFGE